MAETSALARRPSATSFAWKLRSATMPIDVPAPSRTSTAPACCVISRAALAADASARQTTGWRIGMSRMRWRKSEASPRAGARRRRGRPVTAGEGGADQRPGEEPAAGRLDRARRPGSWPAGLAGHEPLTADHSIGHRLASGTARGQPDRPRPGGAVLAGRRLLPGHGRGPGGKIGHPGRGGTLDERAGVEPGRQRDPCQKGADLCSHAPNYHRSISAAIWLIEQPPSASRCQQERPAHRVAAGRFAVGPSFVEKRL